MMSPDAVAGSVIENDVVAALLPRAFATKVTATVSVVHGERDDEHAGVDALGRLAL
jgi:DNA recombination-dependent growth factor C